MKLAKQKAYRLGVWAEFFACIMLRAKGYYILHKRYKTKVGELDIIAAKRGLICFVEVKARMNKEAVELVSVSQQKRICRAASSFIANNAKFANVLLRFDVVVIYPWTWPKHIKSAWDDIG